jgi:hypothetical protein
MLRKGDVFPLLLDACPSFRPEWDDERSYWGAEIASGHVGIIGFPAHIIDLFLASRTECFPAVFALVERMIVDGDGGVQDLATAGLLEDLQNMAVNEGIDVDSFVPWLAPQAGRFWCASEEG